MLTDEQIEKLNYVTAERLDYEVFEIDQESVKAFARAIEAEVRKQDEELVRQMVEALELALVNWNLDFLAGLYDSREPLENVARTKFIDALKAARARLGEGVRDGN